ncbi:MAG: hypothetical protein QG657_973 [Acidobacteriota bacterium]|nr:hypothetical protein [Acidobacteriota bacterium]
MEKERTGLEIAVIGMAGKFPGAVDIHEFWDNIKNGRESISFFSDEELLDDGLDPALLEHPHYVKASGIIEGIECFDAPFFGYTPREAEIMDPQVRIFHECVWAALEDAGCIPGIYDGLIGLYAGATPNFNWQARVLLSGKDSEIGSFAANQLSQKDYLTLRISYKLDLKGPSFVLYTACSTSLVAIHLGCQSILNGECDIALAGGVTVIRFRKRGYTYQEGMIGSPDGHCRAFDAGGNGFAAGDGAGVVVLKRLQDAIADRDHIYAVVKGSAINNDGVRKAGFTAPSVDGQAEVIKTAFQMAEVEAESIGYIEAHGTGTALGDPVEIEGLKLAFNTNKKGFCALGSVKTNVGHLDSAAGVVGFIKTVLVLKHSYIPSSLYFEIPNPGIDFISSPFYVNSKPTAWENGRYPLRAGISSFGQGGTNAHIILEEPPKRAGVDEESSLLRPYQLILLSAKSEIALQKMTQNLANYLEKNPSINLADVVYTLHLGRKEFKYRWMAVCSMVEEIIHALKSPEAGETHVLLAEDEVTSPIKIENTVDRESLIRIGRLWLNGRKIDWKEFYSKNNNGYCVPLPKYPFEKQRYWIDMDPFIKEESLFPKKRLEKIHDMTGWFYIPTWTYSPLPNSIERSRTQSIWLLFLNGVPVGEHLAERLKEENTNMVIVRPGAAYRGINFNEYTVNPQDTNSYDMLFKELLKSGNVPDNIIHCWSIASGNENRLKLGIIDQVQDLGLYSLLNIAQAIGKNSIYHEIQLGVITSSMQSATGEEALCPEKATILGPVKVIPLEYSNVCCRSIDIIDPGLDVDKMDLLVTQILREFSTNFSEHLVVAYRGSYRWKESYEPIRLNGNSQNSCRFKENGVYLITGGLGGMGFTIAEHMARRHKSRLILIDILDFPPRDQWDDCLTRDDKEGETFCQQIRKIREMENLGAEIYIHHVDVSNYERMKEAIGKSEERFGKINGVIHAAGLIDYAGVIHRRTREMTEELLAAKVRGTLVINELLANNKLDFMVLFSSIGNLLYKIKFGQVGYNAGHEFLGVFAYYKQKQGTYTVTIDWCDWSEVGMAIKAAKAANLSTDLSDNILAISPSQGIQVFDRILENDLAHVIISSRDLGEVVKYVDNYNIKLESGIVDSLDDDHFDTFYERPKISTSYTPPENKTQQELVNIWQRFFGIKPVGIDDDFFELGGDSLKIIAVVARIQKEIGTRVPIPEFFNTPTIKGLANYISGKLDNEIPLVLMEIELTEEKEYYSLSSAQKRIYLMQEIQPDSFGYNMPNMVILEGECDKDRLGKIFRKLIERHESLRTSFVMVNDTPVQKVHKSVDFEIDYYDLSKNDISPGASILVNEKIDKMIKTFVRAFDLSKAPLLRVGVIKIAETEHFLIVDTHHIISDGISMGIFVREFMILMVGKELTSLKLQFKDYSEWQSNPEVKLALKHQEDYWLKEFSGGIPELNMPFDYERPPYQSFEGGWVKSEITEKETTDIKELAREEDVTLFMVLIAFYSVLLAKLSGQEDIIIGTGIAGRRFPDIEPLIGMFVNTLAIRNYPCKEKTFKVFLAEVREKALLAFENQDYQFEELVEKILVSRKMGRNPLFDVALILQNQKNETRAVDDISGTGPSGLKFRPYKYDNQASKFDMAFFCEDIQGKVRFTVEYCSKLFKQETIEKFIAYFKQIIASVIDNKDIKIKDITISHHFLSATVDQPKMELEF